MAVDRVMVQVCCKSPMYLALCGGNFKSFWRTSFLPFLAPLGVAQVAKERGINNLVI